MDHLNRRQILGLLGGAAGTAALPASPARGQDFPLPTPPPRPYSPPSRPVTCVIVGHGGRGSLYAGFARKMPQEWKVVGVAEPIDYRRQACAEGHALYEGRRTRILGTKGDVVADERALEVTLFEGGRATWDATRAAADLGGHGGGDVRMVRDLVQAVSQRRQDLIPTTLPASMESHRMGFVAEESRTAGGAVLPVALDL